MNALKKKFYAIAKEEPLSSSSLPTSSTCSGDSAYTVTNEDIKELRSVV
jgi:hypothetical protein